MKIKGKGAILKVNGIDLGKVDFQIWNTYVSIGPHVFEKSFGEKYISFLKRIEEDPQDKTTKLIMCDFLEENQQTKLLEAWQEIIETERCPSDYGKTDDEINYAWFYCHNNLKLINLVTHHIYWDHCVNMTGKYECLHMIGQGSSELRFYGTDFVYAYHDYAQAIIKLNEAEQKKK